nr:protein ripply3 [Jaculus jaculus]
MRPEAATGVREARGHLSHCPGDDPRRPSPQHGPESSSPAPWRPWMLTPGDAELTRTARRCEPGGNQCHLGSKGAFGFQHPVRLYLPISKQQEYLQSSGVKVLASFPVQATIHFYNDDSGSESEEEPEEDAQPTHLQEQWTGGLQGSAGFGPSSEGSEAQPLHIHPPGDTDCSPK